MDHKIEKTFGKKVRIRVCGVLIEEERVLLAKHQLGPRNIFWSPPGGGLEYGESMKDCVKREFLEETGLEIRVEECMGINEFRNLPLHAIEVFFFVSKISGTLKLGNDPELPAAHQLLTELAFLSVTELNNMDEACVHPFFYGIASLEELHLGKNRFIG